MLSYCLVPSLSLPSFWIPQCHIQCQKGTWSMRQLDFILRTLQSDMESPSLFWTWSRWVAYSSLLSLSYHLSCLNHFSLFKWCFFLHLNLLKISTNRTSVCALSFWYSHTSKLSLIFFCCFGQSIDKREETQGVNSPGRVCQCNWFYKQRSTWRKSSKIPPLGLAQTFSKVSF